MTTRVFDQPESQGKPLTASHLVAGRSVLVSGAGGSIGRALVQRLVASGVTHLVLLDASEQALYEVDRAMQGIGRNVRWTPVLGGTEDRPLLAEVIERHRPQVIFHTAAFKHVPLLEQNPFAAISNNVFGTEALLREAIRQRVGEFVLVSTDKAVDPLSIMGASKRIAELILLAHSDSSTKVSAVRLGNVWRSQGSVVELFREQIAMGGPVTITDPEVRRFFLSLDAAVGAIVAALEPRAGGVILVPEVGEAVRILDVAEQLIAQAGHPTRIVYTQLRPGDKMAESMISAREQLGFDEGGVLRSVESPSLTSAELRKGLDALTVNVKRRDVDGLIAAVLAMVPEYTPSAVVRSLAGASV